MQKAEIEISQRILSDSQSVVSQVCKRDKQGKAKQYSWWIITEHVLAGIAWNG